MRRSARFRRPVHVANDTALIQAGNTLNFVLRDGTGGNVVLTGADKHARKLEWDSNVYLPEDIHYLSTAHGGSCSEDEGEFLRDSNGDLILDSNGDPIPILS